MYKVGLSGLVHAAFLGWLLLLFHCCRPPRLLSRARLSRCGLALC